MAEDKYKMKCMNHRCLFQWDTYTPERQVNRVCQRCGCMNIKAVKQEK